MGEPQRQQVTDSKAEVDANDEEHVVAIPASGDEPLGHGVDVVYVLDRFACMFPCYFVTGVLDSRRNQASLEQPPGLSYCLNVDDCVCVGVCTPRCEVYIDNLAHERCLPLYFKKDC